MKPADVVLVKFPFSNLDSTKKRPALILSTSVLTAKVKLVTLAMITSKTEGIRLPGDYLIQNWSEAHLLHPSLLRLSKIATLESDLVDKSLGRLTSADIKAIKLAFKQRFQFWL